MIIEWTPESFATALQATIDAKEKKYANSLSDKMGRPLWLLISDLRDIMSTSEIEFEIGDLEVTTSQFDRVFFIKGNVMERPVYELKRTSI